MFRGRFSGGDIIWPRFFGHFGWGEQFLIFRNARFVRAMPSLGGKDRRVCPKAPNKEFERGWGWRRRRGCLDRPPLMRHICGGGRCSRVQFNELNGFWTAPLFANSVCY